MASRGEIKINEILLFNGVSYEREYIFPDLMSSSGRPLRFDFIVFDDDGNIDFLIEYQGEQHYTKVEYFGGTKRFKQQKYNDSKKMQYCMRKGYPLVVIPYWDYDKIDYDYIVNRAEELRL